MTDTFLKQVIFKTTNEIEDKQSERAEALEMLYPKDSQVTVKVWNGSWAGTVFRHCQSSMYIGVKHNRTGRVHRAYYEDIAK